MPQMLWVISKTLILPSSLEKSPSRKEGKQPYMPKNNYLFLDQKRRIVSKMRKQIKEMGVNPDEIGF